MGSSSVYLLDRSRSGRACAARRALRIPASLGSRRAVHAGLAAVLGLAIAACSQSPSGRFAGDHPRTYEPTRRHPNWAVGPGSVTGTIARLEPFERPEPSLPGTSPLAMPSGLPEDGFEQLPPAHAPAPPHGGEHKPPPASPLGPPSRQSRKPRLVELNGPYPKGAVVVVNEERALYLVGEGVGGKSIRYPVAIGAPEEMWTGVEFVADKRTNPTWTPVSADGRAAGNPVPGGDPANPLGRHAIYLGRTLWRIHGTIAPGLIGAAASNGCIRMHNEHIAELYDRVTVGTEVFVVDSLSSPPPKHRGRKIAQMGAL